MNRLLLVLFALAIGCQPAAPQEEVEGEAPSATPDEKSIVPEHTADPAGESPEPMQLPEGSSSKEDIEAALSGGVPGGRWKEGLLFEGISPQPWLKSAANWFPRTEDVQPNEMRIIFMGSAPFIRPGQMNTSAGFALNELDKVFLASTTPKGYHPELMEEWPVAGDLIIPTEALPEKLRETMGEAARKKAANLEVLRKQAEE